MPPRISAERLRWFLAEIAIVTLGILIALSLDGVVESRRERKQMREAASHIRDEMKDNKGDLDKILGDVPARRLRLEEGLVLVERLLDERARGIPDHGTRERQGIVTFGVDLTATAWATAETTGALGHMPYEQVSRYATTYGIQQEVMRLYARMQDHYALVATMSRIRFRTLSTPELQSWRLNLALALQHLDAFEGMGRMLSQNYAHNLASGR